MAELKKSAGELTISLPQPDVDGVPVNQAAMILAQPTYYQELHLERCGRPDCERFGCLQNLYSSIYFLGNTALLSYRAASEPHAQCVPAYDDCRTCQGYDCPIEPTHFGEEFGATMRGVVSQAAAVAGFSFLVSVALNNGFGSVGPITAVG